MPLQQLPSEVLINIFSHLEEQDLVNLSRLLSYFNKLINDEELWKNLFNARFNTINFPSFSQSHSFTTEFIQRRKGINQWKHNRAVRTKYVVAPTSGFQQQTQIENLIFDYPKLACYNDGIITLIQLQSKRSYKKKLAYIPCTTPQGCSTMHFNINAAVFGRFDGRVFGKSLTNKSYLTPVTEFNAHHDSCVTAITTSLSNDDTKEMWCVSGAENGDLIWWREGKMAKSLKIANKNNNTNIILKLAYFKEWTLALDSTSTIYIIQNMETVHTIQSPISDHATSIHFVKFDFGAKLIVLASTTKLFTVSFDTMTDFGLIKEFSFEHDPISTISIDENTTLKEQDTSLAGNDGCYIAVHTANDDIYIFNVREPLGNSKQLRLQKKLIFNERIYTCQLTNLVLVVGLENHLKIIDPTNGDLIKIVQKTDKFPQFLKISQGRMIVGSGNTLYYLQYISDDAVDNNTRKSSHGAAKNKSNKWTKNINSELQYFDEQQQYNQNRLRENNRLLQEYGGDLLIDNSSLDNDYENEHDLQLRIALLESQQQRNRSETLHHSDEDDDEELRRAIEESQQLHQDMLMINTALNENNAPLPPNNSTFDNDGIDDEDEEFRRVLELSQQEQGSRRANQRSRQPLSHTQASNNNNQPLTSTSTTAHNTQHDEDLELAIALSLSELN